jgi:Kelch motif
LQIYDIATKTWTSLPLPSPYATSDLAAWATTTRAYFAGGYDATYTAQSRVFSIDVANFDLNAGATGVDVTDHASLIEARGDVAATVNMDTGYAYVSGGFTHANFFCEPLASVERYSVDGDTWISVASLPTARADKIMVNLEGHTISMGGERQAENICEMDNPSPGELTILVDDVEVLNEDDSTWTVLTDLPETRFRFAAVVFNDTIYTFGGQKPYDESCQCLKTTDEVVAYIDVGSDGDADLHAEDDEQATESKPEDSAAGTSETESKPEGSAVGTSDQGASVTADGSSSAISLTGISASVAVLVLSGFLCL